MINRHYFMVMKKYGNTSEEFSSHVTIVTIKSWFPDPIRAYEEARMKCQLALSNTPGDGYLVESFNRM